MRVSGPGLQAAHWEGARSLLPTGTPPSPGSPMLTLTLPGFWGSSLPLHSLEEALTRVRVTLAPTSSPNLLLHLPFSGPSLLPKLPETPALPELGPQRLLTTHGEPPSPQVSSGHLQPPPSAPHILTPVCSRTCPGLDLSSLHPRRSAQGTPTGQDPVTQRGAGSRDCPGRCRALWMNGSNTGAWCWPEQGVHRELGREHPPGAGATAPGGAGRPCGEEVGTVSLAWVVVGHSRVTVTRND